MEVREGYKKTEVGVIPEDWECLQIGKFTTVKAGGTPSTFIKEYWNGELKWMNSGELNNKRIYDVEGRITKEGLSNSSTSIIPADCVLIGLAGQGKTRGTVAINYVELCTNQSIAAIFPNNTTNSEFMYQYLDSRYTFIREISSGDGGRGGLNLKIINTIFIPIPPLPEQQAIATALSDTDNLINSLTKLIDKKKNIKQGAMQELLTGKKRLEGFSGEWIKKPLADLFDFSGGYSASRAQLSTEGYCYLHYGDIHGSNKQFIDVESEYLDIPKLDIQLSKVAREKMLQDGDVVFVDASEDDEGTSRHIVIINPNNLPYISGLHTIIAKSKNDILDKKFRRYCFQSFDIKKQFRFYAVGTKVSGISRNTIAKIELYFPTSKDEQATIANILSDMDAEIEALEQKLNKYKAIKQGMMQELLTGRIRLIEEVV